MGFALLLLGLLPLAFMPDFLGSEDEPEDEPVDDYMAPVGQGDLLGGGGGGFDAAGGMGQGTGLDLMSDLPGLTGSSFGGGGDFGGAQAGLGPTDQGQADPVNQADEAGVADGNADADNDTGQGQTGGANILQPVNKIDQPDAGGQSVVAGSVLQPVDQIDVASGPDVPGDTVLMPVNPIDTAADDIWVNYDDQDGTGHAEIEDFKPGEDVLHLSVNPNGGPDALAVQVTPSANGQDGLVFVEKQMIAVLKGAAGATADDIKLDTESDTDTDTESESETESDD